MQSFSFDLALQQVRAKKFKVELLENHKDHGDTQRKGIKDKANGRQVLDANVKGYSLFTLRKLSMKKVN